MISIPNPATRIHSQTNRNDVSGTIFASRNINLDDEASIQLAPASFAVMTTADDSDFDTADAMNSGDGKLYVNSDQVFAGTVGYSPLDNLSSDSNQPTPGVEDDTIFFNDTQVVSDGTTVRYLSASNTWSDIGGLGLSGSAPTCLGLFDGQNGLMIGHGNVVKLVDTTWTVDATLTLPNEYKVSSVVSNGSVGYIGTRHEYSGEARLFLWDGVTSASSESYGIENYEIASLKTGFSSVIAFSSDGRLHNFNGGGFEEIAVLPVYMADEVYGDDNNDYTTINNRGLVVDGHQAYVSVSSDLFSSRRYLPHMPGGIWCYDPAVGFYHRFSPSLTTVSDESIFTTAVDTSTNEITVSSAPQTGTPVLYDPGAGAVIGGLKQITLYYVIQDDATTIRLASTYANAQAGTAIDLTSTGSNSQFLLFYNVFDYGQAFIDNRTSLAFLGSSIREDKYAGRFAYAADVRDENFSETTVLCSYQPNVPNRGYFITPKIFSLKKDDKYNTVYVRHDDLGPDDEIVIKYRVSRDRAFPIDLTDYQSSGVSNIKATWSDTDTFTTTQDLSDVVAGNEVEIVAGKGSGFIAHVSSISEASGAYTVNLDEEFPFASSGEDFSFIVDDWVKAGTIYSTSNDSSVRLDRVGGYIQLKIELRGVSVRVIDVLIDGQSYRELV